VPGLLCLMQLEPAQDTTTMPLLEEWFATWAYCYRALARPRFHLRHVLRKRWQQWRSLEATLPWWKRRHIMIGMGLAALLLFPVQMTVLAPAEIVPARPVMVRAPLEGVIKQFFVQPNATVKAGQPLFAYDDEALRAKLDVASQAVQAAESEYRQYAQLALSDQKSKNQIAALQAKLNEKQIELDFLQGQLARATVQASADGVAVIDEPTEWIGKPVQVGERVMKLARPDALEVEAWLSLSDRLDFDPDAAVRFYRAALPFSPLDARLRYIAYEAQPRPEGHFAYRVRGTLTQPPGGDAQIGQRGTAKLYAGWTPLVYWVLRKPLAAIRQYLAI
jgi:multidrug efflux pump subunit AcrA (membrane-fusion protein)